MLTRSTSGTPSTTCIKRSHIRRGEGGDGKNESRYGRAASVSDTFPNFAFLINVSLNFFPTKFRKEIPVKNAITKNASSRWTRSDTPIRLRVHDAGIRLGPYNFLFYKKRYSKL